MKATVKRWVLGMCGVVIATLTLAYLVPAPLSGYWQTSFTSCMCDSRNLTRFEDGVIYFWSEAHNRSKERVGTYEMEGATVLCHFGDLKVRLSPGWLMMTVELLDAEYFPPGTKQWGWRELRPGYISEVLAGSQLAKSRDILER